MQEIIEWLPCTKHYIAVCKTLQYIPSSLRAHHGSNPAEAVFFDPEYKRSMPKHEVEFSFFVFRVFLFEATGKQFAR